MKFTEPQMRPPQEMRSLILQATQGCTWNKCNYCYVSRGYLFMAKKPEDLKKAAQAYKNCFPEETPIYLSGSNPFALPGRKLKQYIQVLREVFPKFQRISMQSRIDDIARKDDSELEELCRLGINHLYIGTESGNDYALRLMNKGHSAMDTVRQLLRLDQAGITYTNFYVLGLAGKGRGEESAKSTAAMFNQAHPRRITTTGLTLFPMAPVARMAGDGTFIPASEREMIEELRTFLTELKGDAIYDGIHYLNSLNYRFRNSDLEKKTAALADIDNVLATCSDEELELMADRKNKISL